VPAHLEHHHDPLDTRPAYRSPPARSQRKDALDRGRRSPNPRPSSSERIAGNPALAAAWRTCRGIRWEQKTKPTSPGEVERCSHQPFGGGARQPFGGVGESGYGREMGFEVMREYTTAKSVWVNVDAAIPLPPLKVPWAGCARPRRRQRCARTPSSLAPAQRRHLAHIGVDDHCGSGAPSVAWVGCAMLGTKKWRSREPSVLPSGEVGHVV
jgi:hypothetical protein